MWNNPWLSSCSTTVCWKFRWSFLCCIASVPLSKIRWLYAWGSFSGFSILFHNSICSLINYVQAGFRKGRGTRDQIANICWIIKKAREFQKSIYFCFIDYAKAFDCADHNKLWKILKEMGIPDHLTSSWNLYAGQKATVRTGHGTTDWFQIGKGVR